DLEYSGLYEDGWVAGTAYAWLTQPHGTCEVVLRGEVPQLEGVSFSGNEVEVLVDGTRVTRRKLLLGSFEIRCPVDARPGRRKVDLRFGTRGRPPAPDNPPFAAHLTRLGFERAASGLAPPPPSPPKRRRGEKTPNTRSSPMSSGSP